MTMSRSLMIAISCLFLSGFILGTAALAQSRQATDVSALDNLSVLFRQELEARRGPLFTSLLESQRRQ